MIWDVKIIVGQTDAVPAHLIDQVFSDDHDLLAAELDPDQTTVNISFTQVSTKKTIDRNFQ